MKQTLVNLTPHAVRIHNEDGNFLLEVPPDGTVARLETKSRFVGDYVALNTRIPVFVTEYGKVVGLPECRTCRHCGLLNCTAILPEDMCGLRPGEEPERGPRYIVSLAVRQAVPDRWDVYSPGELIRDEQGRPIGCIGLGGNP